MPKVKVISAAFRKKIVELRNEGLTYRQITEHVKVPYSTVGALLQFGSFILAVFLDLSVRAAPAIQPERLVSHDLPLSMEVSKLHEAPAS